jgi:hypothetical protein
MFLIRLLSRVLLCFPDWMAVQNGAVLPLIPETGILYINANEMPGY